MKEMSDGISFNLYGCRKCHPYMIGSENSPSRNSPHVAADMLRHKEVVLKEMESERITTEELNPRYYKDAMHNYMILCREENCESYQYKMLAANQVDGLLPCSLRFIDEKCFLYYEITSRQSLACLFEKREMSCEEVNILLQETARMNAKLEEYLLDRERLVLQPEFIFYDFVQEKFYFTYLPGTKQAHEQNAEKGSEAALLEFIADKMENDENGLLGLIYRLCEMAENESFLLTEETLLDLKKVAYPKTAEEESMARDAGVYEKDELWERESGIKPDAISKSQSGEETETAHAEYDVEQFLENIPCSTSYKENGIDTTKEHRVKKSKIDAVREQKVKKSELAITKEHQDEKSKIDTEKENRAKKSERGAGKPKQSLWFLAGAGVFLVVGVLLWWILDNYIMEAERETLCRGAMYLCMALAIGCSLAGVIKSILCSKMEKRELEKQEALQEEKRMEPTEEYMFEQRRSNVASEKGKQREKEIYAGNLDEPTQKLYGMGPWRKYRIALKDFPFTVGQMAGYADYLLEDSSVSCLHAKFSKGESGDNVCMTDLNSLNGTYVNGKRLEPNESIGIHPGDEIRIGKIAFCYR